MSMLMGCGVCCMVVSVWGIIQLMLMGVFYYIEADSLFEDVEPHEYEDYDDFIKKVKHGYLSVALNCWIAGALYFVTLGLSYCCIMNARKRARTKALKLADDEAYCDKPLAKPEPKKEKKHRVTMGRMKELIK